MKLVRFSMVTGAAGPGGAGAAPIGDWARVGAGNPGAARIGALVEDQVVDLQALCETYLRGHGADPAYAHGVAGRLVSGDMLDFIRGGEWLLNFVERCLAETLPGAAEAEVPQGGSFAGRDGAQTTHGRQHDGQQAAPQVYYNRGDIRLLTPLPNPPLIRDCMGFEEHVVNAYARLGLEVPQEWYEIPVYYKARPGSLNGPEDDVFWPEGCTSLDYELEWACVIGRVAKGVRKEEAREYIYGYTIYNDFTARDFQAKEMKVLLGPARGKDFDTGTVLGPCIVTRDELEDPYNLKMKSTINGELWAEGNTGDAYWKFEEIIEFISRTETLLPGEILGSGTVGRGCGLEIGRWLNPNDVVELEVGGIGKTRNQVVRIEPTQATFRPVES